MRVCVCARELECVTAGMRENVSGSVERRWTCLVKWALAYQFVICFWNKNIKDGHIRLFCAAAYNLSGARASG